MFTRKLVFRVCSILLIFLMMSGGTAAAQPLNAVIGTGFTYQGKLTDAGNPANGLYDLEFKLYNDLNAGGQVGSTAEKGNVNVANGLFTVQLDFGDVFDGTALYLEIGVRPGGSGGAYTPLTPRQALTPAPYAIYASKVPWNGIIGIPADFADGVDNGSVYQNVINVAKSGGDFTTITAALASIGDNASIINHYLIHVAPGIYNEFVEMKQYVDIEGSGELATKITFAGSAAADTGTVVGANDAELRFLTVENTGGAEYAIAIYNEGAEPRLAHVTANASGGTDNFGVYNRNLLLATTMSAPTMTDVTASASGGTASCGVWNDNSSPTMTNVTATASGGTSNNFGVKNTGNIGNSITSPVMTNVTATASGGTGNIGVFNEDSSPTMMNVTASASGTTSNRGVENDLSSSPMMMDVTATASGGMYCYGVLNLDSSSPMMTNVTVAASGGTTDTIGVQNVDSASPTINNSVISASGGGTYNSGIYNHDTATVWVNNSQISGSPNAITSNAGATAFVGASQLSGGAAGAGTITCIGAYSADYLPLDSTCQ